MPAFIVNSTPASFTCLSHQLQERMSTYSLAVLMRIAAVWGQLVLLHGYTCVLSHLGLLHGAGPAAASHALVQQPENRRLPVIQRVLPAMSFKRCAASEIARGRSVLQWVFGAQLPSAWK